MSVSSTDVPGLLVGQRLGPFGGRLDADRIRRYAAATKDPNPDPQAGTAMPPVAIVTQIWEAQQAAFSALVPEAVRASMTGGVHGEHDVVLHRPVVPGEALQTWVQAHGSRRGGRHNLITMRYSTYDTDGAPVADQWWTTVLLNAVGDPVGEGAPDHHFPDEARAHPVGNYRISSDEGMPHRYGEVSGDWSEHHFTVEAARGSGSERPFLHGLCTMGLCAQGVVSLIAEGDPNRVGRIAVRFAAPIFVGDDLELHLFQVDQNTFAFEAESSGVPVIRNGLARLRS
jgi:acyl dehydratase